MTDQLLKDCSTERQLIKIEQAWHKLIRSKNVEAQSLRPEISSSWKRCLELNVDPHNISDAQLAGQEVMEENKTFLSISASHLQSLYKLLAGQDYIVMLYSRDGYILDLIGDRKVRSKAENLNVFQGANNAERQIGTCAPSICLAENKAVQVHWHEHFREAYHSWSCSAAPIYDYLGAIIGVLNITSLDKKFHSSQILELAVMSANAIAAEMNYRSMEKNCQRLNSQLNTLVESSSDPLIIFDHNDTLTHINNKAREMLKVNSADILGRDAKRLISNYRSVKSGLASGRQLTNLNFFSSSDNAITIEAHLKNMAHDHNSSQGGLIGVLRKKNNKSAHTHHPTRYHFQDFIHRSPLMSSIIDEAKAMAMTDHTLLIRGESGTGKEVLTQAIHAGGSRCQGPFIAINCAALPKELIQAELFGYESGSFTGASKAGKEGKFEQADGGTIFLDEIGDMPIEAQANLLRVLQEKTIVRIGGRRVHPVDVRVIAATNRNLFDDVENGLFRKDLYYRLSVISLLIPPLRERQEDIWPLIEHFIEKSSNGELSLDNIFIDGAAKAHLLSYGWPGNARELESVVIHFLARMQNNKVTPTELPQSLTGKQVKNKKISDLQSVERQTIEQALDLCQGHISNAAKKLGISRATLYRKLDKYGLSSKNAT